MPYFEYHCEDCKHEFEELVLKPDKEGQTFYCPKCGSEQVTRKVGGRGISFRLYGEGFYRRNHKDTGDFAD